MMRFKTSTEPRIFQCCICGVAVIEHDDMRFDEMVYPNEALCPKHSAYVHLIMDTFQNEPHGKADWEVCDGWGEFIASNKWILA